MVRQEEDFVGVALDGEPNQSRNHIVFPGERGAEDRGAPSCDEGFHTRALLGMLLKVMAQGKELGEVG